LRGVGRGIGREEVERLGEDLMDIGEEGLDEWSGGVMGRCRRVQVAG